MTEAEEKTRSQLKFRQTGKTLIKIIDEEWARGKISPQELKGGCLWRKVSGLQAAIAKRGLDESGLSLAESTAGGGDHFEHRTAGCPFRRRGRGIGASYYAIWDTTSPSLSFGKIAEFVIDAAVVLAIIAIVIAGANSSCGKEYWSVSVKGFWRL